MASTVRPQSVVGVTAVLSCLSGLPLHNAGKLGFNSQCLAPLANCRGVRRRRLAPRRLPTAQLFTSFGQPSSRISEKHGKRLGILRKDGSYGRVGPAWERANVTTRAIPSDAYWVTAVQAVTLVVLMGASAVVAGVMINIKIEQEAVKEFIELEKKGLIPKDMSISDEEFDSEDPVYIFGNRDLTSTPRNRPIRDEFQLEPELELNPKPDMQQELEPASKE